MIAFNAKKIIFITINIIILFVAKTPNIVTLLNNKISIDDLETLVFLMIHQQIVNIIKYFLSINTFACLNELKGFACFMSRATFCLTGETTSFSQKR